MLTSSAEYNLLARTAISQQARGREYRAWQLGLMNIISKKGDLGIVFEPDFEASTSQATKEQLIKAGVLIRTLLESNCSNMYTTVGYPAKLWRKLESRYAGKDQASIWYLHGKLSQLRIRMSL